MVQRKEGLPVDIIDEKNDDSMSESSSAGKAESTSVCSESIKSKEASTIEKGHGKHKTTVLDFSEVEGTYFLIYEFCAIEIDEHQEQSDMAEQSLVNDEHQEHKRTTEQSSLDNHSSDEAQNQEKDEDEMLESHLKLEQAIIQFTQPSCSSNVNEEVYLASNLSIFRFGHNFIVDASISKILIKNLERPMKKDNLLVSDKIIKKHIGQHIVPFRETDSDYYCSKSFSHGFI